MLDRAQRDPEIDDLIGETTAQQVQLTLGNLVTSSEDVRAVTANARGQMDKVFSDENTGRVNTAIVNVETASGNLRAASLLVAERAPAIVSTVEEIAADGIRCYRAGGAILHNHTDDEVLGAADLDPVAERGPTAGHEHEALEAQRAELEDDRFALERAIREDLDLARPGETVVRFEAAGPSLPRGR